MSDLMREEFELEAAKVFGVDIEVLDGARTGEGFDGFPYRVVNEHGEQSAEVNSLLGCALLFWQASRECLVIELPKPYVWDNDGGFDRESDPDSECSMALIPKIDVMQSIHAAGVKTI